MASGPVGQAQRGSVDHVSLLDTIRGFEERLETEAYSTLSAAQTLFSDVAASLPPAGRIGANLLQAAAVAAGILLAYWTTRRAVRNARLASGQTRNAFVGLARLVGFELLALAVATIVGRVLLVRVLGYAPGSASFPAEVGTALVRWLFGLTVALIVFQPDLARLRLVPLDDRGARLATTFATAILGVGHLQNVLIEAGLRSGLPLASAKLLSIVAALGLAAAAVALLRKLRRHGLKPFIVAGAVCLLVIVAALWIAAALSRDFSVYRGAVAMITIVLLALALDRTIALAIRESRRAETMRRLFMVRVALDGLAALVVVRVVLDFWAAGFVGTISASEWRAMTIRITAASVIIYVGGLACAAVHLWIESLLHPHSASEGIRSRDSHMARLSTVLPLIRFAAITLIATIFVLAALSTVGVDVTPLLAGAGVIGLAVSLGSQTLVKDIVAGIFYMMDDVFRLGETIEAGAYSGVIEQIKLRSIRVRGRDGRLHTIPLGELGAVTNLSRKLSPVTIRVGADSPPDRYVAEQFRNRLWSALQSEPAIRAGITGEMTQVAPDSDSGGATLGFRLSMVDGAARQHRERMRFLVEEIIDEPDSAGLRRPVDIEVDEAAAAQPVPA